MLSVILGSALLKVKNLKSENEDIKTLGKCGYSITTPHREEIKLVFESTRGQCISYLENLEKNNRGGWYSYSHGLWCPQNKDKYVCTIIK